jgi:hypothetical protein
MIDIDGLVQETLNGLGVEAPRLIYKGKADQYITWQRLIGQDAAFADDEATAADIAFRADIFSKSDFTALRNSLKQALKTANFNEITDSAESYEKDTGYFHVSVDFSYFDDTEV